jgi:hypothetical protein
MRVPVEPPVLYKELVTMRKKILSILCVIGCGTLLVILLWQAHIYHQGEFQTDEKRQAFVSTLEKIRQAKEGDFITLSGEHYFIKSKPNRDTLVIEKCPQSTLTTKVINITSLRWAYETGLRETDRISVPRYHPAWEANATVHFLQ